MKPVQPYDTFTQEAGLSPTHSIMGASLMATALY